MIHKNMSVKKQADEVRKVKRAENGMILDPVTLPSDAVVGDALRLMNEFGIGGFPVVNASKQLVGIVTSRDLRFEKDRSKAIAKVMTKENLITVDEKTDFSKAEAILHKHRIEKLPVVDSKNKLIGLITYKDIIKIKLRPHACKDSLGRLRVAAAVGANAEALERVDALVRA